MSLRIIRRCREVVSLSAFVSRSHPVRPYALLLSVSLLRVLIQTLTEIGETRSSFMDRNLFYIPYVTKSPRIWLVKSLRWTVNEYVYNKNG